MGRKHRYTSDAALAKEHAGGTTVTVAQPSEHESLGSILIVWPRYWAFHYEDAKDGHQRLMAAHEDVLQVDPDASASRMVDIDLGGRVYRAGVQMVLGSILAVQHLCEEVERVCKKQWSDGSTLTERLAHAGQVSRLGNPKSLSGYEGFVELQRQRDAIEHPKHENTYNASGDWDRVPIAWMVSERPRKAFDRFGEWFESLAELWLSRRDELARPGALDIELRGLRSDRQFKKPPPST